MRTIFVKLAIQFDDNDPRTESELATMIRHAISLVPYSEDDPHHEPYELRTYSLSVVSVDEQFS